MEKQTHQVMRVIDSKRCTNIMARLENYENPSINIFYHNQALMHFWYQDATWLR